MKERVCDLLIIGGGPAGLSAAVEAKRQGCESVIVLERDTVPGGILRQCIHDGFGLHTFHETLTGGQFAQRYIDMAKEAGVEIITDTMVLELKKDKTVYASSAADGITLFRARAIILAMGCRERTRNQVFILGTRPSGVMTAGEVQHYINIDGYLPGKKAVILGSGDIGLIMARRMKLEGIEVEGVYARRSTLGGLRRNAVQCLDDYEIPLHLSTTVTQVHGEDRLTGVTVANTDKDKKIISGTERFIACDLLVMAMGLIPENELSKGAGIEIDRITGGPVLNEEFMTSAEGIFAAGNVAAVFDLVDYVAETGVQAANGAIKYLNGSYRNEECAKIQYDANISYVFPQKVVRCGLPQQLQLFLRVKHPMSMSVLQVEANGVTVAKKTVPVALEPEMLSIDVKLPEGLKGEISVSINEVQK